MNVRDIAFLACRFIAIFIAFETLYVLGSIAPMIFNNPNAQTGTTAIICSILSVSLVSFLLFWFKAEWIASKIVGNHTGQSANVSSNCDDIQSAGFAIVGMFVLAKVVPLIANNVMLEFLGMSIHKPQVIAYYIQLSLEFIIGVSLILGANGISKAIKKLRGM